MRRYFLILAILLGLGVLCGLEAEQGFAKEPAGNQEQVEKESSFWRLFRRIFSKPEPKWQGSASGLTEVTGVRGIEREGELKEVYDFSAVRWMEMYYVDEEKLEEFLKTRHLGPYRGGER